MDSMVYNLILRKIDGRVREELIPKVIEISIKYYQEPESISDNEWNFLKRIWIVNGCGPKWCKICWFISKRLFRSGNRQTFCNIHDLGHFLGGDEFERLRQNRWLYKHTITDISNESIWFIDTLYYTVLAFLFLLFTNSYSYKYYNYS